MVRKSEILIHNTLYDASEAVEYHYCAFPPAPPDLNQLARAYSAALAALVRYDTLLQTMPNSDLLLAPLRARDAVVSSRMEGTISTLEEVLRLEADSGDTDVSAPVRSAPLEVALYARALRMAEGEIRGGYPVSEALIRNAHRVLLSFGRGASSPAGTYKSAQNYIGDHRRRRVDFIPISAEQLPMGMAALMDFIRDTPAEPLIATAIAHVEFEALHPFDDGNGRLGRMLIPLLLWQKGLLSAPHFYVSDYFEQHKDAYIERMRAVSAEGDWTGWTRFFLQALEAQAISNTETVGAILAHYEEMRTRFRDLLRSRWSVEALNYMFENPIFRNNRFTRDAGIPKPTANTFTRRLLEAGILQTLLPPAGRAPGLYAFPSLLRIVEAPQ